MLTMFSITISANEHADDKKLSCDGPYVVYQTDGSVRVISVTENGEVKDTVYAVLPKDFTLHVADHEGKYPFLCTSASYSSSAMEAESGKENLCDVRSSWQTQLGNQPAEGQWCY